MVKYIHTRGVIGQRDIRFHGFDSMRQALEGTQEEVGSEESVQVLSFDGRLFELNVVGALIWDELRRPSSVEDLAGLLEDIFLIESMDARADAESFLDEMLARGLIGVDPSSASEMRAS